MAPNVTITWSATANAQLNEYVHEDDRAAARNAVNARIDAVSADWPLNIEQTDGANYGAGHLLAFKATKTHLEGRPVTVTVNSVFPVHARKAAGI